MPRARAGAAANDEIYGFVSLEEIDDCEYDFAIPEFRKVNVEEKSETSSQKAKKRKRVDKVVAKDDDNVEVEADKVVEAGNVKKKKKIFKKKKAKQVPTQANDGDVEIAAEKDTKESNVKPRKKKKKKEKQ